MSRRTAARRRRSGRLRLHGNVPRRPCEAGSCGSDRNRQCKALARRRGRPQLLKFAWPSWQEEERWWRRRSKSRALENHDRLVDEAHFVRRWRRHAEIEHGEIRRRLFRGSDHGQAAAGIPSMRTVRIAAQIGPISRRRICLHAAAPRDLFAADRQHRSDARRIRAIRIKAEKLRITRHGVERDRRRIGIVRIAEVLHRPVADLGKRRCARGRRCVGGALGEEERLADLRGVPRHFGALRLFADAQPRRVKISSRLSPPAPIISVSAVA